MIKDISKWGATLLFLVLTSWSIGQKVMHSGEIVYERRTNLEKRFKGTDFMGGRFDDRLKEPKVDDFTLYFNDSVALFMPNYPVIDPERKWLTMRNSTLQDLSKGEVVRQISFWGTNIFLNDSVLEREWIITGNKRTIAGYEAKQALWEANDSTRIYAWYAERLISSVGPETYNGLPGVILGLAIEDGGVVYFAKEVNALSVDDIKDEMPTGRKKDYYTEEQIRELVNDRFSDRNIGKGILRDLFIW
jgi:GLPGLI family protein